MDTDSPPQNGSKVTVLAPDLSGGGVTRVYSIAQVLQKLQLRVEVVGLQFGEGIYPPPPPNLPVSSIPSSKFPRLFRDLTDLLERIDGDWIYAVKPKPTSLGVALLKKLRRRCPVIVDIDDWEMSWFGGDEWHYRPTPRQLARDVFKANGALRDPNHPLYIQQAERLVSLADAVTVDTRFLQQRFGGTYLPNGKDTDLFDPQKFDPVTSRERYGLSEYRVLMFPGTARPHKGLEDVLAAIDRLNWEDLRLAIVGGRKPDDYEDRLGDRWGKWIVKLPRFPMEAMPEVVAAAHVVVVPQRDSLVSRAQFPLKLTDGMAMAKPILSTQVGDIPEILGNTGYLVAPSTPEQLASKIQEIFAYPEVACDRGRSARVRCVDRYSMNAMKAILANIIPQ